MLGLRYWLYLLPIVQQIIDLKFAKNSSKLNKLGYGYGKARLSLYKQMFE